MYNYTKKHNIMLLRNFLDINNRKDFRNWLLNNYNKSTECWLRLKKGKPNINDNIFYYLDAVEEALCFGWIDGLHKTVQEIGHITKFSPRTNNSHWSELNTERCKRLETLGLMTDAGRKALARAKPFVIDEDILLILSNDKDLQNKFYSFPQLYQRIRINTIQREKNKPDVYNRMIKNFIVNTKNGKMYGQWNDYGRLILRNKIVLK